MPIDRFHISTDEAPNNRTVTAHHTTVASATEIDIRSLAGGGVWVGTLTDQTTLSYYVAGTPGGTYKRLYNRDGTAVTQAIDDDRAYPLPDEIYGWGALKIMVDGTAGLSVVVSLKG